MSNQLPAPCALNVDSVPNSESQPDGAGRTHTLVQLDGGSRLATGVFQCGPGESTYVLEQNEIVHVLTGNASVTLDDGEVIELVPGTLAYLPRGRRSHWQFHTEFKELWILTD